jgi:hypothetical protein
MRAFSQMPGCDKIENGKERCAERYGEQVKERR